VVPRDELHTCHLIKKSKRKKKPSMKEEAEVDEDGGGEAKKTSDMAAHPVVPDLPNYFNNKAENCRLQDAKERCEGRRRDPAKPAVVE